MFEPLHAVGQMLYEVLFRPVFAFFIVHLGSRRVVHVATTRSPTQQWTAQQLRNATMNGEAPKFFIRDRDDKFGAVFDRVRGDPGCASSRRPCVRLGQRIPGGLPAQAVGGKVIAFPVLGGLHHDYRRAA